jgi:hypothetical protein
MNSLTIQTRLDANLFKLSNIGSFLGKDVIITIIEVPQIQEKKNRKWAYLGAVTLDKQLDGLNIRDFAHE